MLNSDDLNVFTGLGLTSRQAKVYLSLVRSGPSTAKTISMLSNVARQDIYQTMMSLQETGIVERSISTPIKFKATPIDNAVCTLISLQKEKTAQINKEAKRLASRFKKTLPKIMVQEEKAEFVLISRRELNSKGGHSIAAASTCFDVMDLSKNFRTIADSHFEEIYCALRRRVKCRIITEPCPENSFPTKILNMTKEPSFEIRFAPTSPEVAIAIADRKTITVAPLDLNSSKDAVLRSDSRMLVLALQTLFDMMWNQAQKMGWKQV